VLIVTDQKVIAPPVSLNIFILRI